jgi:hypothetical protein
MKSNMYKRIQLKNMTTPSVKNSTSRSPLRLAFLLISLALGCFALSPIARAVCQQGCLTDGNTVLGDDALINNSEVGSSQTALGFQTLFNNTQGFNNTATGYQALFNNTLGWDNTAIGNRALYNNTGGFDNTAIGISALISNTGGFFNTAIGTHALAENTTGSDNTAIGDYPLWLNTTGRLNVAIGTYALSGNTTGKSNTAIGTYALSRFVNGDYNIGVGFGAGANLTNGDYNIAIGNRGVAGEAHTIRIGTTGTQTDAYIAGITGTTVPTGVAVIVDADGHLGTMTSSERFKEAIKPMDKASEAILALKPVTFRYKHELDRAGIPQFGLVAEEVEKVNPDLVARDDKGKPYTVRYEAVNAMLLNEFLKAHRRIEEQDKRIEELTAQLKQQAGQIQKVSAQLELSNPSPQTVLNNQ